MYHKIEQFEEALKCFSKVLAKMPNDKTIFIARGAVYSDMGNHRLAINDFNEAIKIDPEMAIAYFKRGMSKLASKNLYDAISDFNESAKKEAMAAQDDYEYKKNPGISDGLGCCYHALEDYEEALMKYD
jgi:tetratricopeptide (TPR) repeat protein